MRARLTLCLILLLTTSAFALDQEAERYVRLGLELGEYDKDYVDAYLGPKEWAESAKKNLRSKDELADAIATLFSDLKEFSSTDSELMIRHSALLRNVRAMDARIRMAKGETFSFVEEARLIYDATLPVYDFSEFDRTLEDIDKLIPGEGDLAERVDAFRNSLVIPEDRLNAVFDLAIEECKKRTSEHIELPAAEHFILEYVTEQTWSGYNWFQGDNESLMQINLDFPVKIDRAVGLGCHEGYPGHHVWNVLVENKLLKEKGWIEFSIFPLFSPQALIAEGSANYGVDLSFPDDDKSQYERDILFPLAGLDPEKASTLNRLNKLTRKLSHAITATAQAYLDGKISRDEAIEQRRKYALTSRDRAEQSVRFIEQYRSYVLNYNFGKDVVKAYIEKQGADQRSRWQAFELMLTGLPSVSAMSE
jgi:hypothetical protein